MARRSTRGLAALVIALVTGACASAGIPTTTAVSPTTSTTTTTTTTSPTTTTSTPSAVTSAGLGHIDADVAVPDGAGPYPAVVLVHGGGWVAGRPSLMGPLAAHLNDNGYLTVNTSYTLATLERPGFPGGVEDVACAVRYAANHPDGDGTVALIGHSAGAHIGAVVALTGDEYDGGCTHTGSGLPERFVGLAGPYDVSRLGLAVGAFFGGGPGTSPDAWEAGNPQRLADQNTDLDSLIMYGEHDGFVPDDFAVDFRDALVDAGSTALIELVEGARHNDMQDPGVVGDLIVTWLDR